MTTPPCPFILHAKKAERVFGFKPPKQSSQLCWNRRTIFCETWERRAGRRCAQTSVQQPKHMLGDFKYPPWVSDRFYSNKWLWFIAHCNLLTIHSSLCMVHMSKHLIFCFTSRLISSFCYTGMCRMRATNATEICTTEMIETEFIFQLFSLQDKPSPTFEF